MAVSSAVDQAAALLKERITELEGELAKLQRALASLTEGREGRRGPGRPRGSRSTGTRTRTRRRRRGGTRADQAVKFITESPGINASDLSRKMKLKAPNYLYRVLPELEKDGRIKKKGKGYHPA